MSDEKNGSALAVREEPKAALATGFAGSVQLRGIDDVLKLANALSQAHGFVPGHLAGKAPAIAAAILTGVELGLGPMEAMRSIHVVNGKPQLAADLMLARAIRAGVRVKWVRSDEKLAHVKLERAGFEAHEETFSMEDAKRAEITKNPTWSKYPKAMLRARCISSAMRAFCPDVLGAGVYAEGEIEERAGDVPASPPALASSLRSDVEISEGVIVTVPEKLADVASVDELEGWCVKNREAMQARRGKPRAQAIAAVTGAANKVGAPMNKALAWAGLTNGDASSHKPDEGEVPAEAEPPQ